MHGQHSSLDPKALAIAGGAGAVALSLLFGFGIMGAGSMMGGGWMGGGWMTGGYGGSGGYASHWGAGTGLFALVAVLVIGIVAGWITAMVYNALLNRPDRQPEARTGLHSDKTALPNQP